MRERGHFSERGLGVEEAKLDAGARCEVSGAPSRNLVFVLDGECTVNGEVLRKHSAVQVDGGETAAIEAGTPKAVIRMRLPCFVQAIAA